MKSTVLYIPSMDDRVLDIEKLNSLLFDLEVDLIFEEFDELVINFSNCKYFRPNLYAYLVTALRKLRAGHELKIRFDLESANSSVRESIDSLSVHWSDLKDTNANRFCAFREVKAASRYLLMDFFKRDDVDISAENLPAVISSITEIFINGFDHSFGTGLVLSSSHYSEKQNLLKLSICDDGVGIPKNVREYLKDEDMKSTNCLLWAVKKRNTTKSSAGGLGFFVLEKLVREYGGSFEVYSADGFLRFDGSSYKYKILKANTYGTMVTLTLKCNSENRLAKS